MSGVSTQQPVSSFKASPPTHPAPQFRPAADGQMSQPTVGEERKSDQQSLSRISCDSCRIRKIKCPAEKPCCTNCTRKGYTCTYPTKIRRRGPDKNPGARLRSRNSAANGESSSAQKKKAPATDRTSVTDAWAGVELGVLPSAPVGDHSWKSVLPRQQVSSSTAHPSSHTPILGPTPESLLYGQSSLPPESLVTPPINLRDSFSGLLPFEDAGTSRGSVDSQVPHDTTSTSTNSPPSPSHPYAYFPSLPDHPDLPDLPSLTAAGPSNEASTGFWASMDSMMLGGAGGNRFACGTPSNFELALKQTQGAVGQADPTTSMDGVTDGWGGGVGEEAEPDSRRSGYIAFHVGLDGMSWARGFTDPDMAQLSKPLADGEACGFLDPFDPAPPSPSTLFSNMPGTDKETPREEAARARAVAAQQEEELRETLACFEMYVPPGNIQAARDGWWSWILDRYDPDRAVATQRVTKICSTFFTDTHIWLNFLNRDLFFRSLFSQSSVSTTTRSPPSLRAAPHILLAILALTTLLQAGRTAEGQERALMFASEAQSLLAYCIHAGSQDPSLVAAALILAVFELQPHVRHANSRVGSAMFLLDGIGSTVFSKRLDADDARVSTSVTGFPRARGLRGREAQKVMAAAPVEAHLAQWAQVPSWNAQWTEGEMWKEEMRRMCWAACNLGATYSLWCVLRGEKGLPMDICHPEKFRLLFPGEAVFIDHGDSEQGKTTPWAIYQRLICLWHYVHNNPSLTSAQKEAVIREIEIVEEDLSLRVAEEGPKIYYWLSMDWVMIIRRVLGVFDEVVLAKWIQSQQSFTRTLESGLPGFPRIIHRPMHCWWYIVEAFFAIELSIPYPELWSDADKMYALAHDSMDEISAHWGSQASMRPFKTSLSRRYIKTLVQRQSVLREGEEALEEDKALERAVGYVGEIEWSKVKFKCVGRGG